MKKTTTEKIVFQAEAVIVILAMIILFTAVALAAALDVIWWIRVILIIAGLAIAMPCFLFCVKMEQKVGLYKCKKCGHFYEPSTKDMIMAPHIGRTRYMRCPQCHEKSWQKKILPSSINNQ